MPCVCVCKERERRLVFNRCALVESCQAYNPHSTVSCHTQPHVRSHATRPAEKTKIERTITSAPPAHPSRISVARGHLIRSAFDRAAPLLRTRPPARHPAPRTARAATDLRHPHTRRAAFLARRTTSRRRPRAQYIQDDAPLSTERAHTLTHATGGPRIASIAASSPPPVGPYHRHQ